MATLADDELRDTNEWAQVDGQSEAWHSHLFGQL